MAFKRKAESIAARCPTEGEPGVSMAVLHRWAERGFIPAAGSVRLPDQRFTGFPPLLEQELLIVAVEVVE